MEIKDKLVIYFQICLTSFIRHRYPITLTDHFYVYLNIFHLSRDFPSVI